MLVNWSSLLSLLGHIVRGSAKYCDDQYMVLFCNCSLGGFTVLPGGLHARLCHAFIVGF